MTPLIILSQTPQPLTLFPDIEVENQPHIFSPFVSTTKIRISKPTSQKSKINVWLPVIHSWPSSLFCYINTSTSDKFQDFRIKTYYLLFCLQHSSTFSTFVSQKTSTPFFVLSQIYQCTWQVINSVIETI